MDSYQQYACSFNAENIFPSNVVSRKAIARFKYRCPERKEVNIQVNKTGVATTNEPDNELILASLIRMCQTNRLHV